MTLDSKTSHLSNSVDTTAAQLSLVDFIRGCIGGATGLLLSHPIDTIKSNIQNKKEFSCTPRDLYRGVRAPLIGVGLEKAIVFGTFENTQKILRNQGIQKEELIWSISGAQAGFMASFIVTPVERLKILAQTNNKTTLNEMSLRFLYKGLSSTFTREMPGFSIYFSVFEGLKKYYSQSLNLNSGHHFLFGGLSGATAWLFIYPQDLVKTKIQGSKKNLTPIEVIKNIYQESGPRGFFKGFHLALLRAVPLHAGTFTMVEFLKKNWK